MDSQLFQDLRHISPSFAARVRTGVGVRENFAAGPAIGAVLPSSC
jgi:hypothetical protein